MDVMLKFTVRGGQRIPALEMGNGLMKLVPQNGHAIARAVIEAGIDLVLGVPPKDQPKSVTVVLAGGSPLTGGSVSKRVGRHRSKMWRVEHYMYSVRHRYERSWKSNRRKQYHA